MTVVTGLVNLPIAQYAVIEARRTESLSERFVIAYSDEESLRDLIAGPSIVGCGFASREEAQAKIDADFWTRRRLEGNLEGSRNRGSEEISVRSSIGKAALRSRIRSQADPKNRS